MRQIKFRGKRVDNGEWVGGSYHYSADGKYHYILVLEKFNERENSNKVKALDEMCLFKTEVHQVDPATVSQFTGLLDKNGNDIWEGDVVEEGIVVFNSEYLGFFIKGDFLEGENKPLYDISIPEIIGNIHDNPELIN